MKGFYSLLVGALLLFSTALAAQNPLSISIESASATVGQQVCLDVTGDDFDNVGGFQFSIDYDPAVLEWVNGTGQTLVGQPVFVIHNGPGDIRFTWNTFSASGIVESDPFAIAEICFTVLAATETEVAFSNEPLPIEFLDISGSTIAEYETTSGIINEGVGGNPTCDDGIQNGSETGVDCGGPDCDPCMTMPTCNDGIQNGSETGIDCGGPDCPPCNTGNEDDLFFFMSSASGGVGTEVCLDVTTQNFNGIGGFQYTINYDPNVLEYTQATNLAFFDVSVVQPAAFPGQIRVSWNYFQPDEIGETLDDNSVVFTICFTVLENTGTNVIFTGNPIGIEGFDAAGNELNVVLESGTVNGGGTPTCNDGIQNGNETGIDCGGPDCDPCMTMPTCNDGIQNGSETGVDCGGLDCPPCMTNGSCGEGSSNLTFCLENVCVEPQAGQQACVSLNTTNFNAVAGFEFRVNYPAGNLNFTNYTANAALLNAEQVASTNDGQLVVTWTDPTIEFQGVTLPADAELFEFCFVTENTASSFINLSLVTAGTVTGSSITPIDLTAGSINAPACFGGNTCNDGVQNGSETGIDCGGQDCPPCMNEPTCNDGIQNGNETGIDCGGPDCDPCNTQASCTVSGSDLTICIDDICDAEVNDLVCLDFDVTNFTLVTGFQFDIVYPAANLEFNAAASSSNSSLLSPVSLNSSNDGTITALWFDPTPQFEGQTIAGTAPLVTICFTVESAAASTITIEEESFNNTGGNVPLTVFDGSINAANCGGMMPTCTDGIQNGNETGVDCGGPDCPACPTCNDGIQNGNETGVDCGGPDCDACETEPMCEVNGTDLTICIEDICDAEVNDLVCLDFDVTNFTLVTGFQFDIVYPGANLEFNAGASSSNSNLLSPVSLNSSQDGIITALWFDPTPQFEGQTIPETEPLVTICFTVESTSASTITIEEESFNNAGGDVPLTVFDGSINGPDCGGVMPTCNDGIQNGNETGVDCGGPDCPACPTCNDGIQNGNETGVDCGGPDCDACETEPMCEASGDDLTICVESVCDAEVNDQVCLDLTVFNYDTIAGFEYRLFYPGANLEYVSATSHPNIVGSVTFSPFSDGELRVLWFDPDPNFNGYSIPDGEAMATVCFTVESAQASEITIEQESFNHPGSPASPVVIFDGSINAANCGGMTPTCNDGIQNGNETGIDCGGPDCGPCPSGQGDLTLDVSSASVNVGDQACLDVTVEDFTNMRLLDLTLNFDPTNLQVASIVTTNLLPGLDINDFTIDQPGGTISLDWTGNAGAALTDGTILFTVCFNTLTEAVTNVQFDAGSSGQDGDGNSVTLLLNGGTVTAVNNFENLTFVLGSGSGPVNSQVCLDLLAYNFTDITAFSFTINYDPLILDFENLVPAGDFPPGGSFQISEVNDGEITVIWLYQPPDFAGITVADGTSPAQVCFNVIVACETEVEFSNSGTDITATDNNGATLDVDTVDGSVNAGIPCDGGMNPDNLIIDITDANGLAGEEVCVDFVVTNFTGLTDLSFTINYDNDLVSFSDVQNFGLGSIMASNFTVGPLGTITFDWESPNDLGQTIANGNTAFSLCFTVNEVVPASINFAASPVPIQAQNGAGSNVGVITQNGMINPNAPTGDDLTLVMCCIDGEVGDIVQVPIKVYNFIGITGFQFGVSYDPASLQFNGATDDAALPFIFTNLASPGDIRISWTDSGGGCVDIPSGAVLMTLEFEILSLDAATVAFSNSPFPIEFLSCDNTIVQTEQVNCAVNGDGAPTIVDVIVTQPTCHDDTDGRIELVVTGPTNLTYNWAPVVGNGPILTDLAPGTYTVQVVNDDTGESTTQSITVSAPDELLFVEGAPATFSTDITCNGESDGQIMITIAGGVPLDEGGYIIDWSGNLPDGNLQQLGLDNGTYGVTVTDKNGCEISRSFTINEPPPLTFNGLVTEIGETPGSINVTITGVGTPGYNFSWTGPEAFTANTEDITGLQVPGTYCLVMLDANSCPASQCFEVEEVLRFPVTPTITQGCFGEATGAIDISVSGGDSNDYNFSWTGPNDFTANTEDISGLEPGLYTVTVTSGGEMITASVNLETYDAITFTTTVTNAANGNDGAIDITPGGGVPPFTYLWSNGETTQDLANLVPGEYCVTVTDSQECTNSDSCYVVESGVTAPTVTSIEAMGVTCFDNNDGQAIIVLAGGQAPFTATSTPGDFSATTENDTIVFNDLPSGTYTFEIVDNAGNVLTTIPLTVSTPDPVTLDMISLVSDADDGSCAGSITIMPTGGTGDLSYNWNIVGVDGPQISGLCAGEYAVTITDDNNCEFEFGPFTIEQITATAAVTDVACAGDATGAIDLMIGSGVGPFTFAWRLMGDPTVIATTEDVDQLTAGTYEVTITDETGASLVRQFVVETSLGFSVDATITSAFNGSPISCAGAADGAARVEVTSGLGSYSYEWFNADGELISVDSVITDLDAGVYTYVVLSDDGCEETGEITITEPDRLDVSANVIDVSCFNERDGRVSLDVTGGTGGPSYNYAWSNGGSLSQIQFLLAGEYSVVVTDANGCNFEGTYTVGSPAELIATVESTDADDGCNGTVTVIPLAGGGTNFNYRWLQLPEQGSNPVANNLCPGDYIIEVFDENNCQTVTVTANVRDRRFPCLSERNVITPNGDGLNESFILFCTDGDEVTRNTLEIYNRWGQLVYQVNDYNCSTDGGLNCFEGRTNNGEILPEGPYYYVLDYTNPLGEVQQKRGSLTIVLE